MARLLSGAVFVDLANARQRIGWFIDYYNFLRTHSESTVWCRPTGSLASAVSCCRHSKRGWRRTAWSWPAGQPKNPFYLTGQVSGQAFSVHAQGERLLLTREGSPQQEIELAAPSPEDPAASSAAAPPEPICPHGAPESWPGEPAEAAPPAPGDEMVIDKLRDELGQEPGDTDESEVL